MRSRPETLGLARSSAEVGFGEILEDIAAVPRVTDALVARGHSDEVILKFLAANYLRVFETVWGE